MQSKSLSSLLPSANASAAYFLTALVLSSSVGFSADPAHVLQLSFDSPNDTALGVGEIAFVGGPTSVDFRGLPAENQAIELKQAGAHLRIPDDESGNFDFELGDPITLEGWVRIKSINDGANIYIVSKGRTYEAGVKENHNYGLRLLGSSGSAKLSFLFSTLNADKQTQYHRWNSDAGFSVDGGWHHVAVCYVFGEPKSIRGFVDGKATKGKWDMGGETTLPPVVDDDSIWIGSSRGGAAANSLVGGLDQVCIHRSIVPAEELSNRRIVELHPPRWPATAESDRVTITLHEAAGSHAAFPHLAPDEAFRFTAPLMAVHRLPLKYAVGGIRDAWNGPVLMRAFARSELPDGEIEFLLRSPGLARLWVDGEPMLDTPPHRINLNAHQPFDVYDRDLPWIRVPRSGVHERRVKLTVTGGVHEIILESLVGSNSTRCETNETIVAIRQGDAMFQVLSPAERNAAPLFLVDEDFLRYRDHLESHLSQLDRQFLSEQSKKEDAFWQSRHDIARATVAEWPAAEIPEPGHAAYENNVVDRFLNADHSLEELSQIDQQLSNAAFLRRLSLDIVGVPPTPDDLHALAETPQKSAIDRRPAVIRRLLDDDRWADHWTSYWQDVLAENPNILKPSLNNTGPFRLWIHDSLLLNKPMDRFVTELIRMEGNSQVGGPSGFSIATENDVPMAEKAHVIASAFLAIDMKCARCHDAPYHPWSQRDLFSIGAMLNRDPIEVPVTSSVPLAFFDRRGDDAPIKVTLKPGEIVIPEWPAPLLSEDEFGPPSVAQQLLDSRNDSRERLAAMIVRAENRRFAQSLVNRVWTRLMGWGLVDGTDDWYEANVRFPELLDYLARELVTSGYDLKHVNQLILESRAYGRHAIAAESVPSNLKYLAPWQRRMSAEQLVDSLHFVSGVAMETEEITFDPEGSQQFKNFLNLGVADRAWKLASLSNERDRPSLNLPRAAAVVECLEAFGWRSSRQSPVTHRETEANFTQPGVVANGNMTGWISRLSQDSQMTQRAIEAESVESFVSELFEAVLSRSPSSREMLAFCEQLRPGFAERLQAAVQTEKVPPPNRGFATWTNHFAVEANSLVRELERETAAGPEPSDRLQPDWRERAEDAVWALLNAPEFQMLP